MTGQHIDMLKKSPRGRRGISPFQLCSGRNKAPNFMYLSSLYAKYIDFKKNHGGRKRYIFQKEYLMNPCKSMTSGRYGNLLQCNIADAAVGVEIGAQRQIGHSAGGGQRAGRAVEAQDIAQHA